MGDLPGVDYHSKQTQGSWKKKLKESPLREEEVHGFNNMMILQVS